MGDTSMETKVAALTEMSVYAEIASKVAVILAVPKLPEEGDCISLLGTAFKLEICNI
ncbi:hypothetical protein [Leptospira interrogans]|uniref:hypothetical protein n=2 Tax=Leptospira interrogans TaxID=173 RepID=UPI0002BD5B10|nr:hypothetical protein LEP1GSC110_1720 [Leptospira interrogans serovar Medanensis str. UT053]